MYLSYDVMYVYKILVLLWCCDGTCPPENSQLEHRVYLTFFLLSVETTAVLDVLYNT